MRYILKATGASGAEAAALQAALQVHHACLIDGSLLPHAALVEVNAEHLPQLRTELGNAWTLVPEKSYSVPDTRKKSGNKRTLFRWSVYFLFYPVAYGVLKKFMVPSSDAETSSAG